MREVRHERIGDACAQQVVMPGEECGEVTCRIALPFSVAHEHDAALARQRFGDGLEKAGVGRIGFVAIGIVALAIDMVVQQVARLRTILSRLIFM